MSNIFYDPENMFLDKITYFNHFRPFFSQFSESSKISKNPKKGDFCQKSIFSKCFICFHMMIYGWKCHLGTLKSHLKPIYDIYDVITAFFGKSIFFDFLAEKIFSPFLLMQKLRNLQFLHQQNEEKFFCGLKNRKKSIFQKMLR